MAEIKLTQDQRQELIRLEKWIPHKVIAIRIRVILALDDGYKAEDVARILLIDEDTITRWKKKFLESRYVSDWLGNEYKGYAGKLNKKQEEQVEWFVEEQIVTDCQKVVDYIKETFGMIYTVDGVTKLLHRLKFVYKQTVVIPAKADKKKQEEFIKQYEELKKNLKDTEKILFVDGVHPTHNTRSLRCWVKKGEEKIIKTNSGRDRLNINGALNLKDMDVTAHFSETINAQATIEFFAKIQVKYDEATQIFMIVDNARYYKNKDVQNYLQRPDCRIRLIFLPSYSPNLNFIERLWKFMRQKIIGVKYREKFTEFERDIVQFFNTIHQYQNELKPYIGTQLHLIQA